VSVDRINTRTRLAPNSGGPDPGIAELKSALAANEATHGFLRDLDEAGAPQPCVTFPSEDDVAPTLIELAVPNDEINDIVATVPDPDRTPGAWWLLERCVQVLRQRMGVVGAIPFPKLPGPLVERYPYFYVHVFLGALPAVQQYHRARGISDRVSRRSLMDLGRNLTVHRMRYGARGLDNPDWFAVHFSGGVYDLGRLQFQRSRLDEAMAASLQANGLVLTTGDPVLEVHIPEFWGPLKPEASQRSFERARDFFPRHFPEERYDIAVCHSWLLDDQLQEYLPERSNIVQFQRRFNLVGGTDNDSAIARFVFGQVGSPISEMPRQTRLEQAIVAHLEAGRHWKEGAGWTFFATEGLSATTPSV
jgi:GNAT-like C-terminal domain/N-acyltransferase N-terminal domain